MLQSFTRLEFFHEYKHIAWKELIYDMEQKLQMIIKVHEDSENKCMNSRWKTGIFIENTLEMSMLSKT